MMADLDNVQGYRGETAKMLLQKGGLFNIIVKHLFVKGKVMDLVKSAFQSTNLD